MTRQSEDKDLTVTRYCHIFPESLSIGLIQRSCSSSLTDRDTVTIWTILDRCVYKDMHGELFAATTAGNIYRSEKAMTLDTLVDLVFDRMPLWFKKSRGRYPSYYNILFAYVLPPVSIPERVLFVAHNRTTLTYLPQSRAISMFTLRAVG
ncbi:hypothetical protein BD414DRAFT_555268 [Trametes punicea]|nr:hypothetical protein BD414DRAFT_555268 [Trametes punicea]